MSHHLSTGMSDTKYNLVSALYHALQGATSCTEYIKDAEKAGDEELAKYFSSEMLNQYQHLAKRAQELLSNRL